MVPLIRWEHEEIICSKLMKDVCDYLSVGLKLTYLPSIMSSYFGQDFTRMKDYWALFSFCFGIGRAEKSSAFTEEG